MRTSAVVASALLSSASASTVHIVNVAYDPSTGTEGLEYFPDNISAAVGDYVQFQFWGGNHTATQGNFDNPCVPISDVSSTKGFFSGFEPAEASKGSIPVYTIQVTESSPMWVFCSQANHCEEGMSMVINEDTAANSTRSIKNYQAAAANSNKVFEVPSGDMASGGSQTTIGTSAAAADATMMSTMMSSSMTGSMSSSMSGSMSSMMTSMSGSMSGSMSTMMSGSSSNSAAYTAPAGTDGSGAKPTSTSGASRMAVSGSLLAVAGALYYLL